MRVSVRAQRSTVHVQSTHTSPARLAARASPGTVALATTILAQRLETRGVSAKQPGLTRAGGAQEQLTLKLGIHVLTMSTGLQHMHRTRKLAGLCIATGVLEAQRDQQATG